LTLPGELNGNIPRVRDDACPRAGSPGSQPRLPAACAPPPGSFTAIDVVSKYVAPGLRRAENVGRVQQTKKPRQLGGLIIGMTPISPASQRRAQLGWRLLYHSFWFLLRLRYENTSMTLREGSKMSSRAEVRRSIQRSHGAAWRVSHRRASKWRLMGRMATSSRSFSGARPKAYDARYVGTAVADRRSFGVREQGGPICSVAMSCGTAHPALGVSCGFAVGGLPTPDPKSLPASSSSGEGASGLGQVFISIPSYLRRDRCGLLAVGETESNMTKKNAAEERRSARQESARREIPRHHRLVVGRAKPSRRAVDLRWVQAAINSDGYVLIMTPTRGLSAACDPLLTWNLPRKTSRRGAQMGARNLSYGIFS